MMWIVQVFVGAFLAGLAVGLIAWAASKINCTALRELPDRPIPMEHKHGGHGGEEYDRY